MNDTPAPKRVSKRLRFEVFRRDGFRCRYCGAAAAESGEGLTVDHVVPVALGGANDPSNLVTACRDCNAGKTSSSPDEHTVAQVADDALRWAAAVKLAHEEAQASLHAHEAVVAAFERHWNDQGGPELASGWRDSIRRFAAEGLTQADLLHFTDATLGKDRIRPGTEFRYFAGICWNVLTERHARARQLLEANNGDAVDIDPMYDLGWQLKGAGVGRADVEAMADVLADSSLLVGWGDARAYDERYVADDVMMSFFEACAGGHSGEFLVTV